MYEFVIASYEFSPRGWCPHQTHVRKQRLCTLTPMWTGGDTSHGYNVKFRGWCLFAPWLVSHQTHVRKQRLCTLTPMWTGEDTSHGYNMEDL